jgi:hypothetical protein
MGQAAKNNPLKSSDSLGFLEFNRSTAHLQMASSGSS